MSAKQNMVWNDEADARLLIAFLKVSGLTTDEVTCTPRAVQEHLKKLRKIAQGEAGPATPSKSNTTPTTTPVKAPRKKAGATPTGVKKTRKPACGGKGKKGNFVHVDDAEDVPTKIEPDSDSDNGGRPPSKKRKYEETIEGSGTVGGGESAIGSESADVAQNYLDELLSA